MKKNDTWKDLWLCNNYKLEKVKVKRKIMRKEKELILEFNVILPTGKGNTIKRKNRLLKCIASDCEAAHRLIWIKEDELIL